ncbi:swi5-dependent recombination DNA repair protein 1 homolog [Frieseomelitta varia]|uniref:swi5-dependent recombination DNA repair protein 1 homolog n=1 Tax=Frieseomelitta varia TaxID=561572 RepID=UPI001CB6B005|nr:swi5-dependent recombination DNA repair protein 1 homolog [Frieseomelitta varia]XP_043508033.1 swi5-dependent recombination DNA repair protein 1 homolog [Frieseomelitta varia]XP_043508034.1 swi5-dependent recombination DNA repair protein 1 homolog [Frieseomelitta varia]XP_043508035.1 swi5-dependent recombination DNA repair protein 1 homolog [Frieseomelitta varia]
MSAKPFRNSKGVNKPFRSPFNTPQNDNKKNHTNTPKLNTHETPLKVSVAKRLLFQQSPSFKKLHLDKESCNKHIEVTEKLYQADLESLKKRIQQKKKSVEALKTELLYKKKNKAESIEAAIRKWTKCCQSALVDYQNSLQEKNSQTVKMSEILSLFNTNPDTVRFSIDDDTFY